MNMNSRKPKTLALLAVLTVPAWASVAAQEQQSELPQVEAEAGTIVTGMPPADLKGLPEGPEVKGFISARKDDRVQVTGPDGTKTVDTLMADGTYVTRDEKDKVVDKGAWTSKDGKTCFKPAGKTETCYSESAHAADGSFSATGPDGKVTQVKPHAKM